MTITDAIRITSTEAQMATVTLADVFSPTRTDWVALSRELAAEFAARASAHDADDSFVADNYAELRRRRVLSAPVPASLGGGDASYPELCDMLRVLAHGCSATALALAMHTHPVAFAVRRWRDGNAGPERLLRRLAAEQLVIVSSGGSDWLSGSGVAERTEGGFRVTGHKRFASGVPAGDLLMTTAVLDHATDGPAVLHLAVPLRADGVRIVETWRTLGMRGTGSHDVILDHVFVPDAAVSGRRPRGRWSPMFDLVYTMAFPLVYSVYVGVAEAARDLALAQVTAKRDDRLVQLGAGEMETELTAARLALADMIAAAGTAPGPETTNRVAIGRSLAGRAAIRTVDKAMELVGGAAFYRSLGLERLYRDVQGARFHPMQEKPQFLYTGRLALGMDVND
jgi:acyl-CoA dehydrogenase